MAPVSWATLDPGQTEQVIGVLLCRMHPGAVRIRTSQGDGGIDVLVPQGDGSADVYQIKYFPTALDDSRKAQIRRSLHRIIDNRDVRVRNWYLTLPINPSNPERTWFRGATKTTPFPCHWLGLDRIESLAAAHPDVIDYYLRDGRGSLDQTIADLRALIGLTRPTGRQLVEPSDLTESLAALHRVLNRDDPHYRYEIEVSESPPPLSSDAARPNLVARVDVGSDEVTVTHRVYARYRMATEDAPIPISFQVDEADLAPHEVLVWDDALRYGTPAVVRVRNLSSGLPGGLDESFESALMRIGPPSNQQARPYKIRLGVLDQHGRLLADAVVEMRPVTQGPLGGTRASGTEEKGSFEFELLLDPPGDTERRTILRLSPLDPSGKAPAALERGTLLLAALYQPNRLAFGPEYGPLLPNPFDLPSAMAPINAAFSELIDALAVLQREVVSELVVPDLASITAESLFQIVRAAALLRGETVRDTWDEQVIDYVPTGEIPDAPLQFAISGSYAISVGHQSVTIGPVVVQLLAAQVVERVDAVDGRTNLTLRPALGNNTRLLKRGAIEDVPPTPVTPA